MREEGKEPGKERKPAKGAHQGAHERGSSGQVWERAWGTPVGVPDPGGGEDVGVFLYLPVHHWMRLRGINSPGH